ncbi:RagB/SusD family nutrient uptake outer membrane protein [Paraprevotella clara]|uniref:RagB/SusD family nutrient uptake outer membrane protein n=2 Tax=Paraprevotella clara TaxID=454154 RepID=UPI0040277867
MKKYIHILLTVLLIGSFTACNDFLDREPLSNLSPEGYFKNASQLQAYADKLYPSILPASSGTSNSYGVYSYDNGTDNQIGQTPPSHFSEGEWRVPQNSGDWSFSNLYHLNFFFANVQPKYGEDLNGSQNTIEGNLADIKHYIGEMHFLRALEYFNRYRKFGDYPIITEPLKDDMEILTEASKRSPRNEVARFILSELDKAAELMKDKDMVKTRVNRDVALLMKSRVALFEGTWLKYFKGTAFVPNGDGWPGKTKDYNANYQFPTGSIDGEIEWFLEQAMSASKEVADKYKNSLASNTGKIPQTKDELKTPNPYFEMFSKDNLSNVKEVLLWKQYVQGVNGHDLGLATNQGNFGIGVTRSYVQNFLMADGTPVYTHGSYADGDGYYMGDKEIKNVRENRDSRLSLFLKEPGQLYCIETTISIPTNAWKDEPVPQIISSSGQYLYVTGYALRKGGKWDSKYLVQNKDYSSFPIYRAAEALLNYMEASYEKTGSLDGNAREYWQILRCRALVDDNIDKTISATDMMKEAENDFGAYSAGKVLTDATLYNIRRERRSEFISEGLRYMDLCRWRAMDQLITKSYIPEGIHLWNTPMENWYVDKDGNSTLISDGSSKANVSSKDDSEYLRPLRKGAGVLGYNGFTWKMAHYLHPIRIDQFMITSPDGQSVANSPIYQNPYWPTEANQSAEK